MWWAAILLSISALICLLGFSYLRFLANRFVELNIERPVTYTMPASAQIIDQYTSKADFFGDFDYCATFRVSNTEYNNLLQAGFNWIDAGKDSATLASYIPQWQNGRLPERSISGDCFDRLAIKPDYSATYRYLFAQGEHKEWMKLLAIDEKEKNIFYYRGSW